jgi:FdrA protein
VGSPGQVAGVARSRATGRQPRRRLRRGRYAAQEARAALERGLHVLLFSDNVPLEDEIALKELAVERGLL